MNILHIDTGREMRGGQWQAFYLMRGLAAAGHQVRLLARRGSPLFEAGQAQNFDVRPLVSISRAASGMDLVHAHDARGHTLGLLSRKPLVVSRRVAFPVQRTPASRLKYRGAAQYIAVSKFVKGVLVDAGVPDDKVSVVYDGVPVTMETRIAGDYALALDSDDLGKGKRVVEKASGLSRIPVRFSNDLVSDLPSASLFVYITDLEGLGSAVLLAMAVGVPVLASRVGGLPEAVDDGVSGLLTTNEPEAVAAGMLRLLQDDALAARLVIEGRRRVEDRFSLDRMITGTIRVYERILS